MDIAGARFLDRTIQRRAIAKEAIRREIANGKIEVKKYFSSAEWFRQRANKIANGPNTINGKLTQEEALMRNDVRGIFENIEDDQTLIDT